MKKLSFSMDALDKILFREDAAEQSTKSRKKSSSRSGSSVKDRSRRKSKEPREEKVRSRKGKEHRREKERAHKKARLSNLPPAAPIILVPSASNSLISIYNAKNILDEGAEFLSTADARLKIQDPLKKVFIERPSVVSTKRVARFEIHDNPEYFTDDQWYVIMSFISF